MPGLELSTNVKVADPKAFVLEFSKFAAEILQKPEAAICVKFIHEENMTFAGTFDPTFYLSVVCGGLSQEANDKYAAALFSFFEEKLGVPSNRAYISFVEPVATHIAYSGLTFATLRAKQANAE